MTGTFRSGPESEEDDVRSKDRRLVIIVITFGVVAIAWLGLTAFGSRQVIRQTSEIREAASTAVVDPADIALDAYGPSDHPIADALGVDPLDVSLRQTRDNRWCVSIDVSGLLSSDTLLFTVDDNGSFTESIDCAP